MAAGPIFNAMADLTRIGQPATLERIQAVSGATMANVVTGLKANAALIVTSKNNIRLNLDNSLAMEAAFTALATSWSGV